jgi:hypothetical protein
MTYNRYALERVGGLEIIYNRRGQIVDIGICERWQRLRLQPKIVTKTITMAIIKKHK